MRDKTLLLVLLAVLSLALAVSFAACGSDDSDSGGRSSDDDDADDDADDDDDDDDDTGDDDDDDDDNPKWCAEDKVCTLDYVDCIVDGLTSIEGLLDVLGTCTTTFANCVSPDSCRAANLQCIADNCTSMLDYQCVLGCNNTYFECMAEECDVDWTCMDDCYSTLNDCIVAALPNVAGVKTCFNSLKTCIDPCWPEE